MEQQHAYSLETFIQEVKRYTTQLKASTDHATVVMLHGDLGAGKTTFTQILAQALGVTEQVTSPTFLIQKTYALPSTSSWKQLIHIDAYRLKNRDQLEVLGWDELWQDPQNIICIEWPEHITGLSVPEAWHVYLTYVDTYTRSMAYS